MADVSPGPVSPFPLSPTLTASMAEPYTLDNDERNRPLHSTNNATKLPTGLEHVVAQETLLLDAYMEECFPNEAGMGGFVSTSQVPKMSTSSPPTSPQLLSRCGGGDTVDGGPCRSTLQTIHGVTSGVLTGGGGHKTTMRRRVRLKRHSTSMRVLMTVIGESLAAAEEHQDLSPDGAGAGSD
jgi:hypothetical protein